MRSSRLQRRRCGRVRDRQAVVRHIGRWQTQAIRHKRVR
jgi:hypothetical protein